LAERGALSFFAATAMDPPLLAAGVLSHADGRLKNGVNMLATGCELVPGAARKPVTPRDQFELPRPRSSVISPRPATDQG